MSTRTIVIIGAGFSGTAVAINLLRLGRGLPLRVVLLDRAQMARGLAYRKLRHRCLLNVPAGRISANPDEPLEFLRFAQQRDASVTAGDFVPRELYGDYLEAALKAAEDGASGNIGLLRVYGEALALENIHRSSALNVHLLDGRTLRADQVVLALGNSAPSPLPGRAALGNSSRVINDPWAALPRFRAGETVLIAGTGLTMADVVCAGMPAAKGGVLIHAISRHGLLPAPQAMVGPAADSQEAAARLKTAASSVRRLLREVRQWCRRIEQRGGDWREAFSLLRDLAPALWQGLSHAERRRFLRHVRPYWDVHRHRLPESQWDRLENFRRQGQVQVHAGHILGIARAGKQLAVTQRPRGASAASVLMVDRVVNCTGPNHDIRRTPDRLLRSLVSSGTAIRDPLGLGLETTAGGALVSTRGLASRNIYYIGPLLRAAHWEATAVGELRVHARNLAALLLAGQPATGRQGLVVDLHFATDRVDHGRAVRSLRADAVGTAGER